ncbi:MAG: dihydroorotate dehydrogenase 2 [Nitrososphaerota archaeon]
MLAEAAFRLLRKMPPETSHVLGLRALALFPDVSLEDPALRVRTALGTLRNPVGLAAGFDKTGSYAMRLAKLGFGYVTAGTFTASPRPGNPRPRLVRLREQEALLNAMGFPNPGIEEAVRRLSGRRGGKVPLMVSIGAVEIEEMVRCYRLAQQVGDGIEVNISSPNTPELRSYLSGTKFRDQVEALRPIKSRPTYLKVHPPIEGLWEAVLPAIRVWLDAGFEGVTAVNALPTEDRRLSTGRGGLSGRPLFPLMMRAVTELRRRFGREFELNAVGGVFTGRDAVEALSTGANTVQLYTVLAYRGPYAVRRILEEILAELRARGLNSVEELMRWVP